MPLGSLMALGGVVVLAVLCAFAVSAVIGMVMGRLGLHAPDDQATTRPAAQDRHGAE